jgi:hypothetical protein
LLAAAEVTARWEESVSHQFKRRSADNGGRTPSTTLAPGLALTMWNPFLAADVEALAGFGTIAREWQEFLGRRLKEDVALMQRLARCYPRSGSVRVWRFLAQGGGGLRQGNHHPDRSDDGHGGQDGRGGAISDRRNERKAVSAGSSLGRARREAPGCHRMYKHIHRDRLHS